MEYRISSVLGGKLTMLRKAILKPILLGIESRLERKSLLTLLQSNSSSIDSHTVDTLSTLCPGVHELGEKTAYYYYLLGRAVARALIGGLNIHIFMLYPIDLFSNQVDFKRN